MRVDTVPEDDDEGTCTKLDVTWPGEPDTGALAALGAKPCSCSWMVEVVTVPGEDETGMEVVIVVTESAVGVTVIVVT